jgi:hypothetical protein
MAAGSTYTPIATTTTSGSIATTTFSSISGAYTDLVLIVNGGASSAINMQIQFNGDTGTNYSRTALTLDNVTPVSSRQTSVNYIRLEDGGYFSTTFPAKNSIINIMNYSNATTYKTAIGRANNAGTGLDAAVGLWRSTAAITSVTVYVASGNFTNGTTLTLYGIVAA